MKTYRYFLAGLGNIGRSFLEIVSARERILAERYDLALKCVGVSDSSGSLTSPEGVDIPSVIRAKKARLSLASIRGTHVGADLASVYQDLGESVDMLLDATPVNLEGGDPGYTLTKLALSRGFPVVTANKGPLALHFNELASLSDWTDKRKPMLRFSATVGGAMPTINVGVYDMPCAHIMRVEAVLNATTQIILEMMAGGQTYETAVQEAQRLGIAETDPKLDVEGWDAACKLVIITNTVLRQPCSLADVSIAGIDGNTANEARAARVVGERMSLLATAEWDGSRYRLGVAPTPLSISHSFGQLTGAEMGVQYESDLYERITLIARETGPGGSSAAMLRDVINISVGH